MFRKPHQPLVRVSAAHRLLILKAEMERIADAIRELSERIAAQHRIPNGDKLEFNDLEPQPTDSENRLDPQN